MAVDATLSKVCVKKSIKKFVVDELRTGKSRSVQFDIWLDTPRVQGRELTEWISFNFGPISKGSVSFLDLEVFCASREDPEGDELAAIRDDVVEVFSEVAADRKAIDLFETRSGTPWTKVGGMVIFMENEGTEQYTASNTKFVPLTFRFKWGAKT
jgi:hypothetical protein